MEFKGEIFYLKVKFHFIIKKTELSYGNYNKIQIKMLQILPSIATLILCFSYVQRDII